MKQGILPGRDTRLSTALVVMLTCALIFSPLEPLAGQEPQSQNARPSADGLRPADRSIRVDVDLVLLNVTVTDPFNRLVTGLEAEHFRVWEEGTEQEVLHFSAEDVPISIGVVFDMSGSMSSKLDKARMAAVQFFRTANPRDEFLLVTFNERAQLLSRFTTSVEELQSRLMYAGARGRTALFDAIYLALSQMKGARNTKRALLIISDGGDNHSRYNERDIRNFIREADVQLYAIGIYDPLGSRNAPELASGPSLLTDLCEMTGGRHFSVQNLNDLPDIATKISMELRNQYVIGYKPSNPERDGKWRKVRVRVRPQRGLPPLNVYAKAGYYAPNQ